MWRRTGLARNSRARGEIPAFLKKQRRGKHVWFAAQAAPCAASCTDVRLWCACAEWEMTRGFILLAAGVFHRETEIDPSV